MYLSDFPTVIISSSTFPCIILFFIQAYPTEWLFTVFTIHMFTSLIVFYQCATMRTCSDSWSFDSNLFLLNFIIHFKWFVPRARLQILIRYIASFVSTNFVVWTDPFFTTNWTKITIIASWTSYSSSFKISLKKIFLTLWALNCELTNPIFTQSIFKLLNLLFREHSNFSAKTKIPFTFTMCPIRFIGRTCNFINVALNQTSYVLSHAVSANNMPTRHSGCFSLTTDLILFIWYNQSFDLIQLTF